MGELLSPYHLVYTEEFQQIKKLFWEAPLDVMRGSRIVWQGLNGKTVITNAVPFWELVCRDAACLKDKTWQRFRGWSEDFHKHAAFTILENEIVGTAHIAERLFARICEKDERGILLQLCSGKYGLTDIPFPARIQERAYFIGPALVRYSLYIMGSAWAEDLLCPYDVIVLDHTIFHNHPSCVMNDWMIIHHLSAQAERRSARLGAAVRYGKFLSELFPMPRPYYPSLAIMRDDFLSSQRGGYITKLFGKYCISKTNQSGYYKVVKELPNVRFIELVESYQVLEVQDTEPLAPWLNKPGYTLFTPE
jgi:hypothetical protein